MALIDLDDEFLELLYGATSTKPPAKIDVTELKKQLFNIIDNLQNNSKSSNTQPKSPNSPLTEESTSPAILVVDDLGVITYQLKVLLSQFQYEVDCSQEIYDAVNKFKKRRYDYVVMDLFIPTEREGFILLTELKKMAAAANLKTVIGVITASPRKEIEQQCKTRGADFFLEKNSDWQNTLFSIMDGYINVGKEEEDY